MLLLHHSLEILHLADRDRGAVLLMVALDRGCMGVAAVTGDGLRQPITADGFLQEPERRLFVPVLRQENVNGLAVFLHGARAIAPLTLHCDACLVHTPAHPYRPLAPMERLFEQGTVCDHPARHGGVVDWHPPLRHPFFDMARAQGRRERPPHPHQTKLFRVKGSFEAHDQRRSPCCIPSLTGESIAQSGANEQCARTVLAAPADGRRPPPGVVSWRYAGMADGWQSACPSTTVDGVGPPAA